MGKRVFQPTSYTPEEVSGLRRRLDVSQSGFAQLMAVSVVLVQSWEQGVRRVSPVACRLMDEIANHPDEFLKRNMADV